LPLQFFIHPNLAILYVFYVLGPAVRPYMCTYIL